MIFTTNLQRAKKFNDTASAYLMIDAIKENPEDYGLTKHQARTLDVLPRPKLETELDGTRIHSKFWMLSVRLESFGRKHFYSHQ